MDVDDFIVCLGRAAIFFIRSGEDAEGMATARGQCDCLAVIEGDVDVGVSTTADVDAFESVGETTLNW